MPIKHESEPHKSYIMVCRCCRKEGAFHLQMPLDEFGAIYADAAFCAEHVKDGEKSLRDDREQEE